MVWGAYNEGLLSHTQEVSYLLPPGAGVRGKLISKMRKQEAQYTASLTAIFDDNTQVFFVF